MIPRISSIENLIASDPPRGLALGGRNVFSLVVADQLRLAAQSLRLARRVGIVSGFFIAESKASETDGPGGAKVVGQALTELGIAVDYITDARNADVFRAIGLEPLLDSERYLDDASPTHLISIERAGRGADGRYRNMHGDDITQWTAPLDQLFIDGSRRGLTTIGIGDGGNEIGMGRVFADDAQNDAHGSIIASTVPTDFSIAAGVSNWGAYGLAGALSVLVDRDLLPTAATVAQDIHDMVGSGAVDGITLRREPTVDGLEISYSLRMLEEIRRQTTALPIGAGTSLTVGVLGYGESGRAAAELLSARGHTVRVSESDRVVLEPGVRLGGIETCGHSIEFLQDCDMVVASPGVRPDAPIRDELHARGIPVVSEIELAYQLCARPLIAVTGTIGKRTTVELMQRMYQQGGVNIDIGGNRGLPLSTLLMHSAGVVPPDAATPIAVAVSSFQLESVVGFRPDIAVILNIREAHLDRHRSLAEYERIKSRIFMNQHAGDALILPFDDVRLRHLARKHRGRTFFVSAAQPVDRGAWLADGSVFVNTDGSITDLGSGRPTFPENLLAAVVSARLSGIAAHDIATFIKRC